MNDHLVWVSVVVCILGAGLFFWGKEGKPQQIGLAMFEIGLLVSLFQLNHLIKF